MITRWLNRTTGIASGAPPTVPVLIIGIDYTSVQGGCETVVYEEAHQD